MISGYVLIQTQVGMAASVGREVGRIKGVLTAEVVTGPYDVIAVAQAQSLDELGQLVVASVQAVEGVTRTLTCPIVRI